MDKTTAETPRRRNILRSETCSAGFPRQLTRQAEEEVSSGATQRDVLPSMLCAGGLCGRPARGFPLLANSAYPPGR